MNAQSFLSAFDQNVSALAKAVDKLTASPGYVYVWPTHHLGASVDSDKREVSAVRADLATIFRSPEPTLTLVNCNGEQAILVHRAIVLRKALEHALAVRGEFSETIKF